MTDYPSLLRDNHLRATPNRIAILEALETTHGPLSVVELLKLLPKGTDRVTTYRALEQFAEKGLVRVIRIENASRYELRHEHDDHHHVVCLKCHRTQDISLCAMENLKKAIEKEATDFKTITDHSFEVFGLCKTCA